mmetsp:Transcript_26385/g.86710  ORF Transcript_26385/g.86710 Transcript_26385/m.86710 type:complete len:366 (+) Transcript_26385:943-2040(+)
MHRHLQQRVLERGIPRRLVQRQITKLREEGFHLPSNPMNSEEVLRQSNPSSTGSFVEEAAEDDVPQQLCTFAPAQPARHDPLRRHSRAFRTVLFQHPCSVLVPQQLAKSERRHSPVVVDAAVSTSSEQLPHHSRPPKQNSLMQRCLAVPCGTTVDIGLQQQQHLHAVLPPIDRRVVKRRVSPGRLTHLLHAPACHRTRVHVGSSVEQDAHDLGISLDRCDEKRRLASRSVVSPEVVMVEKKLSRTSICLPHSLYQAVTEGADLEAGIADTDGLEIAEEEEGPRLGAAVVAEDEAAVPAVMPPQLEGEARLASRACAHRAVRDPHGAIGMRVTQAHQLRSIPCELIRFLPSLINALHPSCHEADKS